MKLPQSIIDEMEAVCTDVEAIEEKLYNDTKFTRGRRISFFSFEHFEITLDMKIPEISFERRDPRFMTESDYEYIRGLFEDYTYGVECEENSEYLKLKPLFIHSESGTKYMEGIEYLYNRSQPHSYQYKLKDELIMSEHTKDYSTLYLFYPPILRWFPELQNRRYEIDNIHLFLILLARRSGLTTTRMKSALNLAKLTR